MEEIIIYIDVFNLCIIQLFKFYINIILNANTIIIKKEY